MAELEPPNKKQKTEEMDEEESSHKKVCKKCTANRASLKYAGPYVLGPTIGISPVKSITQCLARKMGTQKFYSLKLLTVRDGPKNQHDVKQGKMLIHAEYSILSLLHDQNGVIHTHGLFEDEVEEPLSDIRNIANVQLNKKAKRCKRLCLVLDCLTAHDYGSTSHDLINLQHYVIKEKKLPEKEALVIFLDIVRVVNDLHAKNIIHRDLKLGNIVLNKRTKRITITNFCLGKHLVRGDDLLHDQRGSPAYISPDVLSGLPYSGKASDLWALGVVLFTMLYGQFPFYDNVPHELFRKIKSAEYTIPNDRRVSDETIFLIHRLLTLDPAHRIQAAEAQSHIQRTINTWYGSSMLKDDIQIVPDIDQQDDSKISEEETVSTDLESYTESEKKLTTKPKTVRLTGTVKRHVQLFPNLHSMPTRLPVIQRLNQDAQMLTENEIEVYSRRNIIRFCH